MKPTSLLKRFETFLKKYEFSQMKLDNGTVLESDEFKEDETVFIVTEDERVPLPIGEYTLEDGRSLLVSEEGVISNIGEKVEEQKESDMAEEIVKEEEVKEEETMSYVSRKELEEAVSEVKEMIEEVKAKILGEETEEKEEVEMEQEPVSSQPKTRTETIKEEFKAEESEEANELKAELSKPSVEPLKHNPEADQEINLKKIGTNRKNITPMDRILERISKINN